MGASCGRQRKCAGSVSHGVLLTSSDCRPPPATEPLALCGALLPQASIEGNLQVLFYGTEAGKASLPPVKLPARSAPKVRGAGRGWTDVGVWMGPGLSYAGVMALEVRFAPAWNDALQEIDVKIDASDVPSGPHPQPSAPRRRCFMGPAAWLCCCQPPLSCALENEHTPGLTSSFQRVFPHPGPAAAADYILSILTQCSTFPEVLIFFLKGKLTVRSRGWALVPRLHTCQSDPA